MQSKTHCIARLFAHLFAMVIAFSSAFCFAQSITIVESVRAHELNPQLTSYSSDSQILSGLFEGLFSYNPVSLDPQFAIATDYKVSRDKKRWTFTLREDAKFSNGENITASSVRDSWLRLLAEPNAPYSSLLDIIQGAREFRNGLCSAQDVGIFVNGEYSLSIRLVSPANYLPRVLCHSAFSVVHRMPTVYSGPYTLENITENEYILKKNPSYWDEKSVQIEEIRFLQSEDDKENAYLFNVGKADWVTSNVSTEAVLNKNAMQIGGEFGTAYYFFKLSSSSQNATSAGAKDGSFSPWDFAEFRNALLEAMPWSALRGDSMVPAKTFVYPLAGYNSPDGFDYTDVEEAKLMMNDARKKYGLSENEELLLVFEVSQYTLTDEKKALMIQAFEPLGVKLEIRELPGYAYLANVPVSNADMFAYTWIGDFADPLAFLELFRGSSSLNDSHWANAEYDLLLDNAAAASEYERYEFLARAEKILLDSGMVIPVYHPVSFNLINLEEIGGWSTNAFDIHPLKYLYRKTPKNSAANVVRR